MSASMFHLSTARLVWPDAPVVYYIGNLAPDCADIRACKDHTHFRDRPDRWAALDELRLRTESEDAYGQGILMHLYLDCVWDELVFESFQRLGVARYRQEIARASAYMYHHEPWIAALWERMAACPPAEYATREAFPEEKVRDYVAENRRWHIRTEGTPSDVYPPAFCKDFIVKTAADFLKWHKVGVIH
ncbi:MAG: hypothetical protein VB111_07510 [Clostridiaceae bacterium]|nr:hypothetical protein [Clostridiaceae bacterium]